MVDQSYLVPIISKLLLILQNITSMSKSGRFEALKDILTKSIDESPEEQKLIINQTLKEIESDPRTKIGIIRSLKVSGTDLDRDYGGFFRHISTEQQSHSYTRLLVCPIDPTHYRKRETADASYIQCPLHGIALIPEEKMDNYLTEGFDR